MFKIDPTYDVILTYSPICEITGHIFECFDYYLFLREHCRAGILFFDGLDDSQLRTAFNSKYNVDFSDIQKDFIHVKLDKNCRNYNSVMFGKNTTVILTDGNIKSLNYHKIILITGKLYGFLCEYDEFEKQTFNKNIVYLADHRVYGDIGHFRQIDYVKKIPFKFYRRISRKPGNTGMMYTSYVCRKITPDVVKEYHERSGCSETLLVVPYMLPEYENIDGIIQVQAPVPDFFEKFDTYIYTPVRRRFDCSPRLLTECFFYGKKVNVDLPYIDIGLKTRYSDCTAGLERLNLDDGDPILDLLESGKAI